ncbi:putative receptor protein kinase ZmPK1 [Primulina eburnea]|uniref:putative receptor protein kinase ZmPK1 n=1 Tax=Primulina eburnea TaxID=1245227 RepID=UPI003C6C6A45
MKIIFGLTHFALILFLPFPSSSTRYETLTRGSSLVLESDSLISSPLGIFTAGFYPVGDNAYIFSLWYTEPLFDGNLTVVWMANRDEPVNGRYTKLSLLNSGNLVLNDAGQSIVWTSGTESSLPVLLKLHDNGNLVLHREDGVNIWESFDSPTNTLLPLQSLRRNTKLVASRSSSDYSSGLYKLLFGNDNVLALLYDSEDFSSIYWPPPWRTIWEEGRTSYNASKIANFDLRGSFHSSDGFQLNTSDYGFGPQRRMTLDHDGNLRVYSLDKGLRIWTVTWQVFRQPCKIHGICGVNSVCTYRHDSSRRCSCLPGHKMKNAADWSKGCVPEFKLPCSKSYSPYFLKHNQYQFYGYDKGFFPNCTLDQCKKLCSSDCECIGFQYDQESTGSYTCYTKPTLLNGLQTPGVQSWFYLKLPQSWGPTGRNSTLDHIDMQCPSSVTQLSRQYEEEEHGWFKYLFWCTMAIGAFEIFCLLIFLYLTHKSSSPTGQRYVQAATGFKRYTYAELKKASINFSQEIGRGGSGVVYKGTLSDNRIAAIKFLNIEAMQGEAEFLAEVNLIGRLNHSNLIESWGYCAQGKYRILVFEYLEHGSLLENLHSNKLDWKKRYDIAIGTAKGLAYLHEECLEWVLHCDVKPQNILLDTNYEPKVADFGLSKLLNRSCGEENMNVSRIRGTRGYMAPEWVSHLPITSKVDVYSYGIVVLEMVTGKNPKDLYVETENRGMGGKMLKNWVIMETTNEEGWIEKIVDPSLGGEYDAERLGNLVEVALKCAQENRDDRPTMREVVSMLET